MPYGSVPTGNVLQNRGKYPRPGGPQQSPPNPNPGNGNGNPSGGGPYMGGPADGGPAGGPGGRPFPPGYNTPNGGPQYLGPPQFGGRGAGQVIRPGGGIGQFGPPSAPPAAPPAGAPPVRPGPPQGGLAPGGGQASPFTLPDGRTVWIWNGKVYPFNPTGAGRPQYGVVEDDAPQTPQGGQAF